MTVDLVLIRHGETEWSAAHKHTGRTDIPLTAMGRRQAEALGRQIADRQFAAVISSPLSRALETCRIAGLAEGAWISDDAMEWDYGVYEGTVTAEIRRREPLWSVWTHPIPRGESVEEVGVRADEVIERAHYLAQRHLGEHRDDPAQVAVFAHGHFLRILGARWVGLPATAGQLLALDTATICELGHERETRVVRLWNQGCHLDSITDDVADGGPV
ncbi:MAG TPA: histidine phosphatase family protein [Acidimicrobiales bacterium]|nr:histidine phosphatase family protein [Acidimicrobiales bacterium]